jgi:hypothetical protein
VAATYAVPLEYQAESWLSDIESALHEEILKSRRFLIAIQLHLTQPAFTLKILKGARYMDEF